MRLPRALARLRWPYERFWLAFAVSPALVVAIRVVWFGVLGVDSVLQVEHAPRYGAGGFNVGQLPWLDGVVPDPTRSLVLVVYLLQAYLAFCVALGVARRVGVWLLTALYGYTYFASQLDSYQHHYLVFLMLAISCFVPWEATARTGDADDDDAIAEDTDDPGPSPIVSWALRLLTVQVAIVYLWAAVAKLSDGLWRDGHVLQAQIRALGDEVMIGWIRDVVLDHGVFVSWAVAVTEVLLAGGLLVRRLWPVVFVVGVGFHLGVTLAGFEIGLFSYFMFAFYLMLLPGRWYDAAARPARAAAATLRAVTANLWRGPAVAAGAVVVGAVAGWVAAARLPFAEATAVAVAAAVGLAVWVGAIARSRASAVVRRRRWAGAALGHVAACVLLPVVVAIGDQGVAYYKFWAGASRRLGDDAEMRTAYIELIRRWPDAYGPAHYHLANSDLRAGRVDEALAGFRRAQQVVRDIDYRPFLAEAQLHDQAGRGAEAVRAAREALERMSPGSRDYQRATAIVGRWQTP